MYKQAGRKQFSLPSFQEKNLLNALAHLISPEASNAGLHLQCDTIIFIVRIGVILWLFMEQYLIIWVIINSSVQCPQVKTHHMQKKKEIVKSSPDFQSAIKWKSKPQLSECLLHCVTYYLPLRCSKVWFITWKESVANWFCVIGRSESSVFTFESYFCSDCKCMMPCAISVQ